MAFPQQHEVHYPGNPSSAADAPWSDTGFPPIQLPQSAPSPCPRLLPGQPHGDAGVLRDAVLPSGNAAGGHRLDEGRENITPPVENLAAQAQPQDVQFFDMAYYGMANDSPHPQGYRDHIIGDNAGIVQDVPAQAQAAPPVPVIDAVNDEVQQAATGPAPAFNEFPDRGPVPNRRATEVLRQLAILYLNDPNSQLVMIRMGPGRDDEVTVDFTLRLTNL